MSSPRRRRFRIPTCSLPADRGDGGPRELKGAATLVVVSMLTNGQLAMWTSLSLGLFNSIMFPTIFTLAIDGLGRHTGQGSGILCTAIVGGAIIPVIQGMFADSIGIHHAFVLPVLCYMYIAYYGLKGHVKAI